MNNLEYYLSLDINITNNDPITAELDDIKLYFYIITVKKKPFKNGKRERKELLKIKFSLYAQIEMGLMMNVWKNLKI